MAWLISVAALGWNAPPITQSFFLILPFTQMIPNVFVWCCYTWGHLSRLRKLPGLGASAFRLMILAKETRGKGGRGFLKAKGCGRHLGRGWVGEGGWEAKMGYFFGDIILIINPYRSL
jgi:hypothetical protein